MTERFEIITDIVDENGTIEIDGKSLRIHGFFVVKKPTIIPLDKVADVNLIDRWTGKTVEIRYFPQDSNRAIRTKVTFKRSEEEKRFEKIINDAIKESRKTESEHIEAERRNREAAHKAQRNSDFEYEIDYKHIEPNTCQGNTKKRKIWPIIVAIIIVAIICKPIKFGNRVNSNQSVSNNTQIQEEKQQISDNSKGYLDNKEQYTNQKEILYDNRTNENSAEAAYREENLSKLAFYDGDIENTRKVFLMITALDDMEGYIVSSKANTTPKAIINWSLYLDKSDFELNLFLDYLQNDLNKYLSGDPSDPILSVGWILGDQMFSAFTNIDNQSNIPADELAILTNELYFRRGGTPIDKENYAGGTLSGTYEYINPETNITELALIFDEYGGFANYYNYESGTFVGEVGTYTIENGIMELYYSGEWITSSEIFPIRVPSSPCTAGHKTRYPFLQGDKLILYTDATLREGRTFIKTSEYAITYSTR